MSKKVKDISDPLSDFLVMPGYDEDGVQASSGIDHQGREHPDPVPMAPPVGYSAPPDLMQMIRSMVQSEELRRSAEAEGFDTFEEADDFDIEDDPLDPLTPYERVFEPPPAPVQKAAAELQTPAAAEVVSKPDASPGQQSSQSSVSGSEGRVVDGQPAVGQVK